jgi:alpha-tubulin suppressor-like RCC1 family protein
MQSTCGLDERSVRFCWGLNSLYGLGLNDTTMRMVPSRGGDGTVTYDAYSVGAYGGCGIARSGGLRCWGRNTYGQGGNGGSLPLAIPTWIGSESWSRVSVGGYHACAIATGGTLYCWGLNEAGQVGDNSITTRLTPVQVYSQSPTWSNVSAGSSHTCGIRTDKTLYCWGYNFNGQLGIGHIEARRTPQLVEG